MKSQWPSEALAGGTVLTAAPAAGAPVNVAAPVELPATAPAAHAAPAAPPPANGSIIRVVSLERGVVRDLEGEAAMAELKRAIGSRQARVWVDVCEATQERMNEIGRLLELHPLLVEDLAERDQRAKLEQMGDVLHLVVFSLGYDDGVIYDRELDFVLGKRFLLSSHSRWWDPRKTHHLRTGLDAAMARGVDYILWALCDDTIDAYFPLLDHLGDEIDALEDEVVAKADRALLEKLFEQKRELITIRRVTAPEREMFNVLSSREETPISVENRLYYRDSYDHLIRLTDELDTYRELASATLETYLSTVNNNLSLIMKRLTGVTVVVAGIGAIGGIFGMSEAQFAFRGDEGPGFWIVSLGSLVLAGLAVSVLRKIDWI
jgi:magnesium transporter